MQTKLFGLIFLALLFMGCGGTAADDATAVDAAALPLGEAVYVENCASCHGENLEGAANWQDYNADGSFRAPPHDATGHTWHHGDGYLRNRILYGVAPLPPEMRPLSNMPAYEGKLTDEEILAVLAYIRSTWPEEARAAQARATAAEETQP